MGRKDIAKRNTQKALKGGFGEGLLGNKSTAKIQNSGRRSVNDGKIRVQFLKTNISKSPYSIISVTKGPSTGIFDYMWYNINNIEEMLHTAMYGLTDSNKYQDEKVFNIIHNETSQDISKEDKDSKKKGRSDDLSSDRNMFR